MTKSENVRNLVLQIQLDALYTKNHRTLQNELVWVAAMTPNQAWFGVRTKRGANAVVALLKAQGYGNEYIRAEKREGASCNQSDESAWKVSIVF